MTDVDASDQCALSITYVLYIVNAVETTSYLTAEFHKYSSFIAVVTGEQRVGCRKHPKFP